MDERVVQPFGKRQHLHHIVIAHGHRLQRISLPPWAYFTCWAAAILLCIWTVGATSFIVFRDRFVGGLISRQATMQYQYEDRIAALRAELDRFRSKELVDSSAFGDKIEMLLRRQSSLETRQSIVQSLTDMATSSGLKPQDPEPLDDNDAPQTAVPPSIKPDVIVPGPGKQAGMIPDGNDDMSLVTASTTADGTIDGQPIDDVLDRVDRSLDAIDLHQSRVLASLEASAVKRATRIRDALDGIDLDVDKIASSAATTAAGESGGEGGPFIPLVPPVDASPFEQQAYRVQTDLVATERYNQMLTVVPVRRPFPHAPITSGFGARLDPFLGVAAMHPGIDFGNEIGAAVPVTASGRVTRAGWVGGYGNMVEVDHGNGLSTRYGHMSKILVVPGQIVTIGETIGLVGSTGRSTGPHLHYETRINGEAVDPMRFLRAGAEITQAG